MRATNMEAKAWGSAAFRLAIVFSIIGLNTTSAAYGASPTLSTVEAGDGAGIEKLTNEDRSIVKRATDLGRRGKAQEAREILDPLIRKHPDSVALLCCRALIQKRGGHNVDALLQYTDVLKLKPDCLEALLERGSLFSDNYDFKRALKDLKMAIKIDPNSGLAYHLVAAIYYEQQKYPESIAASTEAIRLIPNSTTDYLLRGQARSRINDSDKAIEDYTAFVKLDKTNQGFIYRAKEFIKTKRLDLAQKDLKDALAIDPNDEVAHELNAQVCMDAGDYKSALQHYNKILEMRPQLPLALNGQEQALKKLGKRR